MSRLSRSLARPPSELHRRTSPSELARKPYTASTRHFINPYPSSWHELHQKGTFFARARIPVWAKKTFPLLTSTCIESSPTPSPPISMLTEGKRKKQKGNFYSPADCTPQIRAHNIDIRGTGRHHHTVLGAGVKCGHKCSDRPLVRPRGVRVVRFSAVRVRCCSVLAVSYY